MEHELILNEQWYHQLIDMICALIIGLGLGSIVTYWLFLDQQTTVRVIPQAQIAPYTPDTSGNSPVGERYRVPSNPAQEI